jgi:hypothetical protein
MKAGHLSHRQLAWEISISKKRRFGEILRYQMVVSVCGFSDGKRKAKLSYKVGWREPVPHPVHQRDAWIIPSPLHRDFSLLSDGMAAAERALEEFTTTDVGHVAMTMTLASHASREFTRGGHGPEGLYD